MPHITTLSELCAIGSSNWEGKDADDYFGKLVSFKCAALFRFPKLLTNSIASFYKKHVIPHAIEDLCENRPSHLLKAESKCRAYTHILADILMGKRGGKSS